MVQGWRDDVSSGLFQLAAEWRLHGHLLLWFFTAPAVSGDLLPVVSGVRGRTDHPALAIEVLPPTS